FTSLPLSCNILLIYCSLLAHFLFFFFLLLRPPPRSTLFPYTTLFRSSPLMKELLNPVPCVAQLRDDQGILCNLRNCQRLQLAHRSEEHTSELQSRENLVCRLLLEKKKKKKTLKQIERNNKLISIKRLV